MDYRYLKIDLAAGVATVTICRPPVNAMSPDLLRELDALFAELPARPGVRAAVLRSGIPGQFMAGADLMAMANAVQGGQEPAGMVGLMADLVHGALNRLDAMPIPTIAAIAGHCVGGGLEMSLACDFRLMADDGRSRIGLPEIAVGIIPGAGGTQRLPRVIGLGRATEMVLRAQRLTPRAAEQIGLIHRALPPDQFEQEVGALAQELAEGPTVAYAAAKAALRASFGPLDGLAVEKAGSIRVAQSEDAAEGITAFFARRRPQFRGR